MPLKFLVSHFAPGELVLIKTWKEDKLQPRWDRPSQVLLTTGTAMPPFWVDSGLERTSGTKRKDP